MITNIKKIPTLGKNSLAQASYQNRAMYVFTYCCFFSLLSASRRPQYNYGRSDGHQKR